MSYSSVMVGAKFKDDDFAIARIADGIEYVNRLFKGAMKHNETVEDGTVVRPEFSVQHVDKLGDVFVANANPRDGVDCIFNVFMSTLETEQENPYIVQVFSATDAISLIYMKAIGLSLSCLSPALYLVKNSDTNNANDEIKSEFLPDIISYEDMCALGITRPSRQEFLKWASLDKSLVFAPEVLDGKIKFDDDMFAIYLRGYMSFLIENRYTEGEPYRLLQDIQMAVSLL